MARKQRQIQQVGKPWAEAAKPALINRPIQIGRLQGEAAARSLSGRDAGA